MIFFILVPALLALLVAMALPSALKRHSVYRVFTAMILSFLGVVLPIFVFMMSGFLLPEWKGACPHGWIDCFILGKLALTPMVLGAAAAWYRVEVLGITGPPPRWVVVAMVLGAVTADVCLVFGLGSIAFSLWMVVPGYVAIWYSARALQLVLTSEVGLTHYFGWLAGSLPLWLISLFWSHQTYQSLPDKAPTGCFIVTAAGRGHRKCVGPFYEIDHNGRRLEANKQLLRFWHLEACWRKVSPRSHCRFRRVYNRFGPILAARIQSPWLADAAYLALKPAEYFAAFVTSQPPTFRALPGNQNHEHRQMD